MIRLGIGRIRFWRISIAFAAMRRRQPVITKTQNAFLPPPAAKACMMRAYRPNWRRRLGRLAIRRRESARQTRSLMHWRSIISSARQAFSSAATTRCQMLSNTAQSLSRWSETPSPPLTPPPSRHPGFRSPRPRDPHPACGQVRALPANQGQPASARHRQ